MENVRQSLELEDLWDCVDEGFGSANKSRYINHLKIGGDPFFVMSIYDVSSGCIEVLLLDAENNKKCWFSKSALPIKSLQPDSLKMDPEIFSRLLLIALQNRVASGSLLVRAEERFEIQHSENRHFLCIFIPIGSSGIVAKGAEIELVEKDFDIYVTRCLKALGREIREVKESHRKIKSDLNLAVGERRECVELIDQTSKAVESAEDEILEGCVALLNEKKTRIRELEDKLHAYEIRLNAQNSNVNGDKVDSNRLADNVELLPEQNLESDIQPRHIPRLRLRKRQKISPSSSQDSSKRAFAMDEHASVPSSNETIEKEGTDHSQDAEDFNQLLESL